MSNTTAQTMADAAHKAVQAFVELVADNESYEIEEYRRLSKQHSEAVVFAINNLRDLAVATRREALEEAAKVCDQTRSTWVDGSDQYGRPCPAKISRTPADCAQAIRALSRN